MQQNGGAENNQQISLGVKYTLAGIWEKIFTKIAAHAGMSERIVICLAIEQFLKKEIKYTLEHNYQSYGEWCAQTEKRKKNSFTWPYMIISMI